MGDAFHHTDARFIASDLDKGNRLASELGDIFADIWRNFEQPIDAAKVGRFFYQAMTPRDQWHRIVRAFRFHPQLLSVLKGKQEAPAVLTKDEATRLYREGVIDIWTYAEAMGIPNMGEPPEWADTITRRLQAQKMMAIGGSDYFDCGCERWYKIKAVGVFKHGTSRPNGWFEEWHGPDCPRAHLKPQSLTETHYLVRAETPLIEARCKCGHLWSVKWGNHSYSGLLGDRPFCPTCPVCTGQVKLGNPTREEVIAAWDAAMSEIINIIRIERKEWADFLTDHHQHLYERILEVAGRRAGRNK